MDKVIKAQIRIDARSNMVMFFRNVCWESDGKGFTTWSDSYRLGSCRAVPVGEGNTDQFIEHFKLCTGVDVQQVRMIKEAS